MQIAWKSSQSLHLHHLRPFQNNVLMFTKYAESSKTWYVSSQTQAARPKHNFESSSDYKIFLLRLTNRISWTTDISDNYILTFQVKKQIRLFLNPHPIQN